jgi:hypothetical protein
MRKIGHFSAFHGPRIRCMRSSRQAATSSDADGAPDGTSRQHGYGEAAAPAAAVEGWDTDLVRLRAAIGSTLPAITGDEACPTAPRRYASESLRDRWTILGAWPAGDDSVRQAGERRLSHCARLRRRPGSRSRPPRSSVRLLEATGPDAIRYARAAWPALDDAAGFAQSLGIEQTPVYLLIGPDLTIEGYRGALSATPDDGIKSVIRGIAEIRKQIAAP